MMRTSIATHLRVAVSVAVLVTSCTDTGSGVASGGAPSTQSSLVAEDWQRIPLRDLAELFPAHPQAWQVFASAVRTARPFTSCAGEWVAPPGVKMATTTLELRLSSSADALRIEDVVILESNPADASLERCVDANLRGREFPAPGMPPGQTFRYKWSASKQLG